MTQEWQHLGEGKEALLISLLNLLVKEIPLELVSVEG